MRNGFLDDVLERKQLSRGSRSRKCGSKSKRCSLSSDRLTNAQWKKRNGAVITMNMNKPMDIETFKLMSVDLQEEYIKGLISKYGVGQGELAAMFGVDKKDMIKVFRQSNLKIAFKRGNRMKAESMEVWNHFLGDGADDQQGDNDPSIVGGDVKSCVVKNIGVDAMAISFSGGIPDFTKVTDWIKYNAGNRAINSLTISCTFSDYA